MILADLGCRLLGHNQYGVYPKKQTSSHVNFQEIEFLHYPSIVPAYPWRNWAGSCYPKPEVTSNTTTRNSRIYEENYKSLGAHPKWYARTSLSALVSSVFLFCDSFEFCAALGMRAGLTKGGNKRPDGASYAITCLHSLQNPAHQHSTPDITIDVSTELPNNSLGMIKNNNLHCPVHN